MECLQLMCHPFLFSKQLHLFVVHNKKKTNLSTRQVHLSLDLIPVRMVFPQGGMMLNSKPRLLSGFVHCTSTLTPEQFYHLQCHQVKHQEFQKNQTRYQYPENFPCFEGEYFDGFFFFVNSSLDCFDSW